jgi:hypothetical protein
LTRTSAASRYASLERDREPYLVRGRRSAKVTVPTLLPDKGVTETSDFDTPYQSLGSRGVRTISSKLLLALYPPNAPCFRYQLDDYMVQKLSEAAGTRGEIEKALEARARAVKTEMENTKFRPVAFEAVRQLIVAGNYLVYVPSDPKVFPRGYRLTSYVVRRDPAGTVLEIVIKETIAFGALPEDTQLLIMQKKGNVGGENGIKPTDEFDLYTHVFLNNDGKYEEYQEVEGEVIPDTEGTYTPELLPYVPLRFTALDNEDYGRSFVEEFLGDLLTLEGLSQAILEGAAIGSRVLFLVSPNGTTVIEDLQDAENGDFVEGTPDEVQALQVNKQNDMMVAERLIAQISQRLEAAFMMHMSVQRDAERVTAEEIRKLTEELDAALGGVYSLLSVEFQLPVVRLYQRRMERSRNIPPLPKKVDVQPVIVTGVEALGRAKDLSALDNLVAGVGQTVGPENLGRAINLPEYFKRRATYLGIDTDGLIPTDQEQAQGAQQDQIMALLQQALPQLVAQGGGMAKEQMKQNAAAAQG